ncbi:MAG: four helix bundle protein [Pirellulales bacterium]
MKAEGRRMKEGKPVVDLGTRTRGFALRVVRLFAALPKTTEAQVLGRQLLRCGTSVGAHYREASRARSNAEFVSKLNGGLAELEEAGYWLELLADSKIVPATRLAELRAEADELIAILVTCTKNAKQKTKSQVEE